MYPPHRPAAPAVKPFRGRDLPVTVDATLEEGDTIILYHGKDDGSVPDEVVAAQPCGTGGADEHGWADVHPLAIDDDGYARQAALDGGWHEFPRSFFTVGRLGDVSVPCVSIAAQRRFHSGYELRDFDRHDLAVLDQL